MKNCGNSFNQLLYDFLIKTSVVQRKSAISLWVLGSQNLNPLWDTAEPNKKFVSFVVFGSLGLSLPKLGVINQYYLDFNDISRICYYFSEFRGTLWVA